MNKVLVSLAVVLAFTAVASAQPWLDAGDIKDLTSCGTVWELLPDTTTWIYLYGHSNGYSYESIMGDYAITDPGGNAGPTPTISGFGTTGTVSSYYDSDWTAAVSGTQLAISCGHFGATALAVPASDPIYAIEIDTSGCEISDYWTIDLGGAMYYGPMEMYYPTSMPLGCTLINGQIHIIPEPATLMLLGLGAAGLIARRRR